MPAATGRAGYFGKLPSRSDFVKVAHDIPAMRMLDDWLAQVMDRLASDPRWKLNYDAMAPASFAFVGPSRRHVLAGHIVASHDQAGRRFPFLMMRMAEVSDPASFVARCPLAFDPLWTFFATAARCALAAANPEPQLQAIRDSSVALGDCDGALTAFLATETLGGLGTLLGDADCGRLVLALGLVLQPVMHSKPSSVNKCLVLPLPEERSARCGVAAFWLELVAPFLRRADFDLALFLTHQDGRPVLVVGLCEAAAATLHGIIDPVAAIEQQVRFTDTGWIDEQIGIDVDVRALASYLDQPGLPLRLARELFLKTFIGAAQ